MALVIKNDSASNRLSTGGSQPFVEQIIKVSRATDSLPATATESIFTIAGGRIKLKALVGEVTTAIQAQACNLSVVVNSDAGATNATLASTVDINADEVGTTYAVEGDGTALVATSSGFSPGSFGEPIIQPGVIAITTSATNTGSVKWDLYFVPVDPGAYVLPTAI